MWYRFAHEWNPFEEEDPPEPNPVREAPMREPDEYWKAIRDYAAQHPRNPKDPYRQYWVGPKGEHLEVDDHGKSAWHALGLGEPDISKIQKLSPHYEVMSRTGIIRLKKGDKGWHYATIYGQPSEEQIEALGRATGGLFVMDLYTPDGRNYYWSSSGDGWDKRGRIYEEPRQGTIDELRAMLKTMPKASAESRVAQVQETDTQEANPADNVLPLIAQLKPLASQMASSAQAVYDAWDQNDEGHDEEYGEGGICDDVADAMLEVAMQAIPELEGTTPYDDSVGHTSVLVWLDTTQEAAYIDIPPYVYESGAFYHWRKRPNVQFSPDMVVIADVPYTPGMGDMG